MDKLEYGRIKSMKKNLLLVAFSTWLLAVEAQENAALVELVAAEKAFAADASTIGISAAFLKHLADSAIVFERGTIVNGKQLWGSRHAEASSLIWYPEYAQVSSAGDLGYTTGPAQFRAVKDSARPDYVGYFNSIWKKDETKGWKVVLDMGTPSPDAVYNETVVEYDTKLISKDKISDRSGHDSLPEQQFIADYAKGTGYKRYGLPTTRYYRPRQKVHKQGAFTDSVTLEFRNAGSAMSSSRDLGYAYGYVTAQGAQGNYLRVWKREKGRWKIVLDVATY